MTDKFINHMGIVAYVAGVFAIIQVQIKSFDTYLTTRSHPLHCLIEPVYKTRFSHLNAMLCSSSQT